MQADAIEFEIFKNLFVSIAEEMGETLCRTSFSPNIKERLDYSCAVYDASGETVAQGDHMPVHLGAMPLSVRAAIDTVDMAPGDIVVLNDPFRGGTHLPDITLVSPVFVGRGARPSFYVANRAHHSDVGGMSPGSMPLAREVFQEGLIIPPLRLVSRGRVVDDVMALILANVRTPEEREGDLTAQIAANRVAEARLREVVAKYGRARVTAYAAALQDYTERVMRHTIRGIPRGEYRFADALDDDGFSSEPVQIRVRIRIDDGDAEIDFTGADPQTDGSVNANLAITLSATLYAFRCLVREDVLYNAGVARPLRVIAPPGTVVNATRPAAVAGGNVETSQRITDVVLGALAQALPEAVPAASQGTMNNVTLGGLDSRRGRRFAYYETIGGGMGGRPGLAGISGVHTHMSNTRNTPIEAIEHDLPVRIRQYGLRRGSGGAGAFRGGDGIVREYEMLAETSVTVLSDRRRGRPYGARGGEPGAAGRNCVMRHDGRIEEIASKARLELGPGDRLRLETPGGGGFGVAAESTPSTSGVVSEPCTSPR
jgi:N-methylhydantoinase B/oxoprolinase/acetone carboxylase alpha subunit